MRKRLISLALALILTLALAAPASAASQVEATAGNIDLLFNGAAMKLGTYNIGDSNYVKLRDVAQLLSGTPKQFSVDWNGDEQRIDLLSGEPYVAVGGELAPLATGVQYAFPTTASVWLDGFSPALTAYTINGSNFFKLRDLGSALDFYVGWDGVTNTVIVDTSKGYVREYAPAGQYAAATAMLAALEADFQYSEFTSYYACLVHLDDDEIPELLYTSGGEVHLYYWEDGQLHSKVAGVLAGGWFGWWVCEDTATGDRGIEFLSVGGGDFDGGFSQFTYLSHEAQISDYRYWIEDGNGDGHLGETEYYVGDRQVSQQEHDAARDQHRRVEQLVFDEGDGEEQLRQVYGELYRLTRGEPVRTGGSISDMALLDVAWWAADEMFSHDMNFMNTGLLPCDWQDVITVVHGETGNTIVSGSLESGWPYARVIGCTDKKALEEALSKVWHEDYGFARKYPFLEEYGGDLYGSHYLEYNGAIYGADGGVGDGGGVLVIDQMVSRTSEEAVFAGHFNFGSEFEISLVYEDGLWKFGYFR